MELRKELLIELTIQMHSKFLRLKLLQEVTQVVPSSQFNIYLTPTHHLLSEEVDCTEILYGVEVPLDLLLVVVHDLYEKNLSFCPDTHQ